MLKRRIDWSWVFILVFCLSYGIIANIQSRLFVVDNSIASKTRQRVDFKLNRLTQKHTCEDDALKAHNNGTKLIWIWYENEQTYEYWCGFLDPDKLTVERIKELMPYIKVLNSDNNIRRIIEHESNKHISGRGNLQKAVNR